ncbi:Solid-state culture expressed protein (Aos23) [Penicillium hispanicum]|uniref:Solid-state culture expressed protein (Aos23) n=1 Tax=Penicillium hispanicum TaxID=1080232 RepID=UPI002541D57A|nr:Solid-state culture expressed protein (Aos23) [Penicillium hispanicum]KAJ5587416.1 Solid-state culture expressed protein (Aos23) [Penicillium hispanicum]
MDAVNKVVNAASTALWGENSTRPEQSYEPHGEEPISGVQGKGAATDPYDAGNRKEQPEAPATEDDTAPQEPQLPGQSLNSRTAATAEKTTEAAPSGSNADASSSSIPAASSASNEVYETNENKPSSGAEQRNTETTEGESSTAQPSTVHDSTRQQVSKEALRGPQGPPPHPAEEFEKETKGDKPVFKDVSTDSNAATDDSTDSSPKSQNKSSQGSGSSGSGSGKHSTMAKMKERLNKVAHPRHANPKGTAE